MRGLAIVGTGLAVLGIAIGLVAWLINPDGFPYEVRFYLVLLAVVIGVIGLSLIFGPILPIQLFREKIPFCYLSVYYINGRPHERDDGFQLLMTGVGVLESVNYWISPWGVEPNGLPDDPYYSLDKRKPLISIIHDGGYAWDRFLPLGDYRIDFTTKQGNCYERLTIYAEAGMIKQRITVTTQVRERGRVLYSFSS